MTENKPIEIENSFDEETKTLDTEGEQTPQ